MTKAKVKLVLNLGCDARNNGVYRYAKFKKKVKRRCLLIISAGKLENTDEGKAEVLNNPFLPPSLVKASLSTPLECMMNDRIGTQEVKTFNVFFFSGPEHQKDIGLLE